MCGILGFVSDKIQHPAEAHKFMGALLDKSKIRGKDASGFAAKADSILLTDKHPIAADDFVRLSKAFRDLRHRSSVSMIGHTRAATNGDPRRNKNNHPFHGPRYSIVHNGGIMCFRDIAKYHGFNLETACDSEVILHCLEERDSIREGIINAFNKLDATGWMAVAALDRESGDIHLFRNSHQPCVIMRVSRWNATIFASTLNIILDASEKVFGDPHTIWEWADLTYSVGMNHDMPTESHVIIRPDGSVEDTDISGEIKTDTSFARSHYAYGYGAWYYDDDFFDDGDAAAFNGGVGKYSTKKSIGNNSSQSRCTKCQQFVSDNYKLMVGSDRYCRRCYSDAVTNNANKDSLWKCIECYKNLEESHGHVCEVGRNYVCAECWGKVDHTKLHNQDKVIKACGHCNRMVCVEKKEAKGRKSFACYRCYEDTDEGQHLKMTGTIIICAKPPLMSTEVISGEGWTIEEGVVDDHRPTMRSIETRPAKFETLANIEARLWTCIPSDYRGEYGYDAHNCVSRMTEEREVKYDHELEAYAMTSYMRLDNASTEDKILQWENIQLERLHSMDDGEYLSYIEFLDDLLVNS